MKKYVNMCFQSCMIVFFKMKSGVSVTEIEFCKITDSPDFI